MLLCPDTPRADEGLHAERDKISRSYISRVEACLELYAPSYSENAHLAI